MALADAEHEGIPNTNETQMESEVANLLTLATEGGEKTPRRVAKKTGTKTKDYFRKIDGGDYLCKLCNDAKNSQYVVIPKEKGGCTSGRWRHLRKFHRAVHNKLRGIQVGFIDDTEIHDGDEGTKGSCLGSMLEGNHSTNETQMESEVGKHSSLTKGGGKTLRRGAKTSGTKTKDYFKKIDGGDYLCKLCKDAHVVIPKEKGGCTSGRWRHLRKFHSATHNKLRGANENQKNLIRKSKKKPDGKLVYDGITFEKTKHELLRFIVRIDCPLVLVETSALKRLLSYFAQRDVELPCVNTIRAFAVKMYCECQDALRLTLQSVKRVSLTIDAWTIETQIPVLGIMVHWIDEEWNMCERVLSVEEMAGPHTGENLADSLFKVLKDFLLVDKICAVTTDNTVNNTTMLRHLSCLMEDCNASFNSEHHVPCIAHYLDLTVEDGLKQLGIEPACTEEELAKKILEGSEDVTIDRESPTSLGKLLLRLRMLITAMKMSPQRINWYHNMCEDLGIPNNKELKVDCPTRLNSTFEMLISAISKKKVLVKMAEEVLNTPKQCFTISDEEWDLLNAFAKVLWPFKDVTEMLSTAKTVPVSRIIPYIEGLLKFMQATVESLDDQKHEQKEAIKRTYDSMVTKILNYKDIMQRNQAYVIATVLDPQKKLRDFPLPSRATVRAALLKLLSNIEDVRIPSRQQNSPEASWDLLGTSTPLPNILSSYMTGENRPLKRARVTAEEEVDEYLNEGCIVADPLTWWGTVGRYRFPRLECLAKEYLCICATSTPVDRLFSAGRGDVTYGRGISAGETISALMTLKCWAREDDIKEENEKKRDVKAQGSTAS